MAIQYKKIIKEIMGPEAEKRGFKPGKIGPSGIRKRMLVNYEKKIDEIYTQSFFVDFDTFENKLELSSLGISVIRSFENNDESSFRNVILAFSEIMVNEGYANWEKDLVKPRFKLAEHGYLLKNHRLLAEDFCIEKDINPKLDFLGKIYLINEEVEKCRNKKFEDIRSDLIRIAAFLTQTLLECDGARVNEYLGDDYYTIVSGNMGAVNTLDIILDLWLEESDYNCLKSACMAVLPYEAFEKIDWKI